MQTAAGGGHGRSRDLDTEVAIVGAGPTGLMAALLLARSGVSVRIVDKSPSAAKESRAFGIQARTLELFHSLGLAERFLERGLLAAGARIFVAGREAAGFDFDDIGRKDTPFPVLLILPQSETEEILVEALQGEGIAVERGIEALDLAEGEDMISLSLRDAAGGAHEVRAAYAIGADGAHSILRKRLGLTFEGAPYPQSFLLADCRVEWPLDYSRFKLFLNDDAFGIYLPLKGQDYARVITTAPAGDGEAQIGSAGAAPLPIAEVEAGFRRAVNGEVRLSEPVWTSRYRVHHRGVNRYRVGRAFVAGDAAHIHSPAGGQGMNTGLQDVANLAWKLARVLRGGAPESLLDSYDAERRPVGERVLSATDRVFSVVTSQRGWVAGLRDALVPIAGATIARSGMARARAFHFVSQLGIRYHEGAAVAADPDGWSDGPAAGQRAPDAPVSHRTRLFDLIGGYRFHLLALSQEALTETEIAAISAELSRIAGAFPELATHLVAHSLVGRERRLIQAENGAVFSAFGLDRARRQALYLVRPDGYVAWRAPGLDFAGLRSFVAGRFTPPSGSGHAR